MVRTEIVDPSGPVPGASPDDGPWTDLCAVLDALPVPVEVFAPDGTSRFVNVTFTTAFGIAAGELVGRLNVLRDPYLTETLGLADGLGRAFAGETVTLRSVRVPLEEIAARHATSPGATAGAADGAVRHVYQDVVCAPLRVEDGVMALFVTKCAYRGEREVLRAREYLEDHWAEDFDLDAVARHVGLSRDRLAHRFTECLGTTPYHYYQRVKVGRVREALRDERLTIAEAFGACGATYSGAAAGAFRRIVGTTPSGYRASLRGAEVGATGDGAAERSDAGPAAGTIDADRMLAVLDGFAVPVQVFTPHGDLVLVNRALLRAWNIRDASGIVGAYNLVADPFVNDQFGMRDGITRTFRGETVLIEDLRVPLEAFWSRYEKGTARDAPRVLYTDILNVTVRAADGSMRYVVSFFLESRSYRGRSAVTAAKEFVDNHWRQDLTTARIAEAAGVSPAHLARLFRENVGLSPRDYHREVRVAGMKAALRDPNLSVTQAFAACGLGHPGNASRFFKDRVGMTPSEYRRRVGRPTGR